VTRNSWSGPHTIGFDQIAPYNDTFIGAPTGIPASLWQSDYKQRTNSVFVENGVQLQFVIQWGYCPETGDMEQCEVIESYVLGAFDQNNDNIQAGAIDEYGNVLGLVNVPNPNPSGAPGKWGIGQWGQMLWSTFSNVLTPLQIPWQRPLNFARASFFFQGNCNFGLEFGALYLRFNKLGKIKNQQGNNPNTGPI
jgi:hypothetical protein